VTRVDAASPHDLEAVCALLTAVQLPTAGVDDHLGTALVARDGQELVGCVALEVYGRVALLRSLAVAPSHQGRGLGRGLVHAALELGEKTGVTTFCLLTTTAPDFFARHFDFRAVARGMVPAAVRQSVEFVSACPETAQAMLREA
jgi:N-acetylglutamate synthase-like GNAT family acetyltransferase